MNKKLRVAEYFQPIVGMQPWKAKLGVGSFLTFEFGPKVKKHGLIHGQWHLWIYMADWRLVHGTRYLADSDADRRVIAVAIRRLEEKPLTSVDFDSNTRETTFVFDDFQLQVSPSREMEEVDERDCYWMFFMPENEVLSVGPAGIRTEQADAVQHV
jgi:hypothetical protein